jgi:signal transduction histidine kinase
MSRPTKPVYFILIAAWCIIAVWQGLEHRRVRMAARAALINRSQDITSTLGLVIRSQRRFGGIVSQERLESALKELVKSGELNSVALLNATGEVVASAGPPMEFDTKGVIQAGERWDSRGVVLMNLLDLGSTVTREGETNRPTIVLPRREPGPPPGPDDRERPRFPFGTNEPPPPPLSLTADAAGFTNLMVTNRPERFGPPRGGRPPRMSEQEYKELLERRGLHGLVIGMSTEAFLTTCRQDLWMRGIIGCFATIAVLGLGVAWRNVAKSSELQMRLVRASEMNAHLKEMNLAAAGLAHETRNPLNIIRGLAQLISRQPEASTEARARSREIIDETDRVTGQLNEFINYSRPREVRRAPVALGAVISEVVRALSYDIEEKQIRLNVAEEQLTIEADEQLLRQALFNLLLNGIQAVEAGGEIQIVTNKAAPGEALLEIRDHGPGVAPEHRVDIFKPYFTTHQKGTGLGLAVVQQIVLAHGWEIECLSNQPRGAVFRLSHLLLTSKPSVHAA